MTQEESVRNAELAKLEAERRKLELEAEEIHRRLRQRWYVGRVGQLIIAGVVAAGLLAVWTVEFAFPILTADTALAKRQIETGEDELKRHRLKLEKAEASLAIQKSMNVSLTTQLKTKDEEVERTITDLERFAKEDGVPSAIRERISALVVKYSKSPAPQVAANRRAGVTSVTLRVAPTTISAVAIYQMVRERGFSLPGGNVRGDFRHEYVAKEVSGARVIVDRATALMWQQSGSADTMSYGAAQAYVAKLNREAFAGFSDWRLPTIEELASLVEPTQKNGVLYLDPKFDDRQKWCRSADKKSALRSWGIVFYEGALYSPTVDFPYYVRAVRSDTL